MADRDNRSDERDDSLGGQSRGQPKPASAGAASRAGRGRQELASQTPNRAARATDGPKFETRQRPQLPASRRPNEGPASLEAPLRLSRSPLFSAQHSERYARQALIAEYEERYGVTLIVLIDAIFAANVTYLEELLFDAEPRRPIHLIIASPGGDGEAAIRMVRSIQSRCSQLTVIVPDLAKSAATLMCLGADRILMGPAGDLGPVDPQFQIKRSLVSAREIVAAVDEAEARIKGAPDTFPLFAALLSDVNLLMVEQARSAIQRSEGLVREALSCCTGRSEEVIDQMTAALKRPLIDEPATHNTVVSADLAAKLGLPAEAVDVSSEQWKLLWSLWTRYYLLGCFPAGQNAVYEGRRVSHVIEPS